MVLLLDGAVEDVEDDEDDGKEEGATSAAATAAASTGAEDALAPARRRLRGLEPLLMTEP